MRGPASVSRWRTWVFLLIGGAGLWVILSALSLDNPSARWNVIVSGGALVVAGLIFRFRDYRF